MSYKTASLVELFPDAYSAHEDGSLLGLALAAVGAELDRADDAVKRLLKSHWVAYASDAALDGLGSVLGTERRTMRDNTPEADDAYRRRLQSAVPLFTGGGTRDAIIGAVRVALGLPFDLGELKLGTELQHEVEALITIDEFSPRREMVLHQTATPEGESTRLILDLQTDSVDSGDPVIDWTFTRGTGCRLSIDFGGGLWLRSRPELRVPAGSRLSLHQDHDQFEAWLYDSASGPPRNVSALFTGDGRAPPLIPALARKARWELQATGGLDAAAFDVDTFDLPDFGVAVSWVKYEPMTFDIHVPYFLKAAVDQLARGVANPIVYEGLPPEQIQGVVDRAAAAGVRGNVCFSLIFVEDHAPDEVFQGHAEFRQAEDAGLADCLVLHDSDAFSDAHDPGEAFCIGGVFDLSPFDSGHGFVADEPVTTD